MTAIEVELRCLTYLKVECWIPRVEGRKEEASELELNAVRLNLPLLVRRSREMTYP